MQEKNEITAFHTRKIMRDILNEKGFANWDEFIKWFKERCGIR